MKAKTMKTGVMLNEEKEIRIPVTEVPSFAPRTNAAACFNVIILAPTSPILITVVAAEDWIMAVAPAPKPYDARERLLILLNRA